MALPRGLLRPGHQANPQYMTASHMRQGEQNEMLVFATICYFLLLITQQVQQFA
jgi:hypothetical protein